MTPADPPPFVFADLQGRTVLLTGADRGIGRGLIPTLLAQGLKLFLVSRDEMALDKVIESVRSIGGEVSGIVCDLADPSQRVALARRVRDEHTTVDGIIHNAAIDPRMTLQDTTLEFFRLVMATNVEPALELTRDLLPSLCTSTAGRVLILGSITFDLGTANLSSYVASKGAVVGLTRSLAHELGEKGITVNCISPGAIKVEKETGIITPEGEAQLIGSQSLKRRLIPQDLAGLVCLLLSNAGSAITGQTITVDGGLMHPIAGATVQTNWMRQTES